MMAEDLDPLDVRDLPDELLDNYIVVATDYTGLGTPGVHPYTVNLIAGRDLLDSIRAAQRFPDLGTTADSQSAVWGHSQRGGAALVAAELAPAHAPDANLVGAVAGAPAAEIKLLGAMLRDTPSYGLVIAAAAGWEAAYPDIDLSTFLTPERVAAAEEATTDTCIFEVLDEFETQDPDRFIHTDPGTVEPLASRLEENTPGVRRTDVPIYLYHGDADQLVPVVASQLVLDRYCQNGTPAFRQVWPGADHFRVVEQALPDIERWLADRLEGVPAPTSC